MMNKAGAIPDAIRYTVAQVGVSPADESSKGSALAGMELLCGMIGQGSSTRAGPLSLREDSLAKLLAMTPPKRSVWDGEQPG